MSNFLTDSRSFAGMKSGEERDANGTSFVQTVLANELRIGRHCMIGGFPCRVKEINRAAPGKHGHAKLRTVGQGIFDGKKRETIYIAQHVVPIPVIEKHQNVQCVAAVDGLRVVSNELYHRLPSVLCFPETDSDFDIPVEGQQVVLSLVVACGHYKITESRILSPAVPSRASDPISEQMQIFSKKEARKRKKQMAPASADVAASVLP